MACGFGRLRAGRSQGTLVSRSLWSPQGGFQEGQVLARLAACRETASASARRWTSAPLAPLLSGAAATLERPGLLGCGLSAHALTTPTCRWGARRASAPVHFRASCLCQRPAPSVTLSMGVVEAIDPSPSSCPSPVPGGFRLAHSSSYSPLQGRGGSELELGAAADGVLDGGGQATDSRTPFMDLFCETCSKPWLIGWWDQVGSA